MRRVLHEVSVAGRAARLARQRPPAEPPLGREVLERLRARLPAEAVEDALIVELPARRPPWTTTGVQIRAGDEVTTFAGGRIHLLRLLDIWIGPATQLWFRPGGGPILRGTRATHTFTAASDGPLELASSPPGEFTDLRGTHSLAQKAPGRASGSLVVLVVRWRRGVDSGAVLRDLADEAPAAAELERRVSAVPVPEGWEYLWRTGQAETFRAADGGVLECCTHGDVGLLTRPVDFPLTDATRLRWSWRVDELPSLLPEDTLPSHDYTSIALEFDNGQDLTWYWSAELPPERSYRCPLPFWRDRETHVVVRSGTDGLGQWLTEERPVLRDYAAAVGPPPQRVVGVWLIAVSLFQRRRGVAAYGNIELSDGRETLRVSG